MLRVLRDDLHAARPRLKIAPHFASTRRRRRPSPARYCGSCGEHFFFIIHDAPRRVFGKMIRSKPGRPAFAPMMSSQMRLTLAMTCVNTATTATALVSTPHRACSLVWRRGILYWKTQVPTVSAGDVAVAGHGRWVLAWAAPPPRECSEKKLGEPVSYMPLAAPSTAQKSHATDAGAEAERVRRSCTLSEAPQRPGPQRPPPAPAKPGAAPSSTPPPQPRRRPWPRAGLQALDGARAATRPKTTLTRSLPASGAAKLKGLQKGFLTVPPRRRSGRLTKKKR